MQLLPFISLQPSIGTAAKNSTSRLVRLAFWLVALFICAAQNALAVSDWPVTDMQPPSVSVESLQVGYWIDPTGKSTIDEVMERKDFRALDQRKTFKLGNDKAIWVRMRLRAPADAVAYLSGEAGTEALQPWVLELPMPLLDDVQMFHFNAAGQLQPFQVAGDHLDNQFWTHPANHPTFRLEMRAGETHDVWLQVKNPNVMQIPISLKTDSRFMQDARGDYFLMGLLLGSMLFVLIYVAVMTVVFKDLLHGVFGMYLWTSFSLMLSYSGIGGNLLWSKHAAWVDLSTGVWQLCSSAFAVAFIWLLLQSRQRSPLWSKFMVGVFALHGFSLLFYFFVDRSNIGAMLLHACVLLAAIANVGMGFIAWRRGDRISWWVLSYYAAVFSWLIYTVAAMSGAINVFWYQQYPVFILTAAIFPMFLAALNFKMRHALSIEIRAQGIRSHDALTGALNEPFLMDRMRQMFDSPRKRRESAVVLIDVSNLPYLRERFAQEVVEQTLLRAVIKIKRVFGDVESIGRIGENQMALLVENTSRDRINKLAVELIASGLMPPKNLKQEITIIFHFGIALLDDYNGSADDLLPTLQDLCKKMSPRTQRPIRYLEANTPAKSDLGDGQNSDSDHSRLGANTTQQDSTQQASSHQSALTGIATSGGQSTMGSASSTF